MPVIRGRNGTGLLSAVDARRAPKPKAVREQNDAGTRYLRASAVAAAGIPAAPVLNRAAYASDSDNSRGDWAHAQQMYRQLWHQVGGRFGPDAAAPPVAFDQRLGNPRAAAETYPVPTFGNDNAMSGGIALSPDLVNALVENNSRRHDPALTILVHEMAHGFQSPATLADRAMTEGGAEAFADKVAPGAVKRAGLANGGNVGVGRYPVYQDWVKAVKQKKGPAWVSHGQFMSPAALLALKLARRR